MEEEKFSIEDIMLAWKKKYGINRTSERGKQYTEVSRLDREEHFHYLYSTLIAYGYTPQEIIKPHVCFFLAELCWSEEIQKLSKSIVERKRKEEIKTWKSIVLEKQITFSENAPIKRSENIAPLSTSKIQYADSEERLPTLEEALKPVKYIQDNPKYNTSKLPPIQVDEEFMAELNAIKTTLGKNK